MATATKSSTQATAAPASAGPAQRGTPFPSYDLETCIDVARVIHVKGGGQATPEQLASYLGYKGTNNGAYLSKLGAAKGFEMIQRVGPVLVPTPLAHQIMSPVYAHDAKKACIDAFMSVDLFRRIYEDFKGKELPPESGMKNALRNTYAVAAPRINDAYRVLMDSAETAGFFTTKSGARTHLIMPSVMPLPSGPVPSTGDEMSVDAPSVVAPSTATAAIWNSEPGRSDLAGSRTSNTAAETSVSAKDAYLNALIRLFEKSAADGTPDEKLMARIERLLGLE